jgi:hypothetical protein
VSRRSNSWPIGTYVVVRSPGSWADGLTGTVHHYPADFPDHVTVQLDEVPSRRYLARPEELRTAAPRAGAK